MDHVEDKALLHPFHEQFELVDSCSVYYAHPTAKAKGALIQHAPENVLSISQV